MEQNKKVEKWEIELNQLILFAFWKGLWYSEAKIFDDIKLFIVNLLSQQKAEMVEGILQRLLEDVPAEEEIMDEVETSIKNYAKEHNITLNKDNA